MDDFILDARARRLQFAPQIVKACLLMSLFLGAALGLCFCGSFRFSVSVASGCDLGSDAPKRDARSSPLPVLAHQFVAVHRFRVGCNRRSIATAGRRDKLRDTGCSRALRLDRLGIDLVRRWQGDPFGVRKRCAVDRDEGLFERSDPVDIRFTSSGFCFAFASSD
ncbi:MAG TPA: hypothetical protein VNS60_00310 [Solirubrobacterales bacterium]|nr:hypothetical protein [Solirubrobacterales bacterium]